MALRWATALALALWAETVTAETAETLGVGRLFTNDHFGDGDDRWRSTSYVLSVARGQGPFTGRLGFGDILEYRLRAEIISPAYGSVAPGDRPYAGVLSLGVHTHFAVGGLDYALGADLVAMGPQTGVSALQEAYHDTFDFAPPPHVDDQLGDSLFIAGTAQVGGRVDLAPGVTLRPFAEAQMGAEDMLRIGGDLMIGQAGQDDLWLRDVVTGQLYRGITQPGQGVTYVIGGDIAAVGSSRFLPEDQGYLPTPNRTRARAGVHFQASEAVTFFYGVTWLSEEFEGQSEPQVLGSVKLNFNF